MKKQLALLLVLLLPVVVASVMTPWWNPPKRVGPIYRDFSAAEWKMEVEQWEDRGDLGLIRQPSVWRVWLAKLGLPVSVEPGSVDRKFLDKLDDPDASGVPIMIELMKSHKVIARQLAAEALAIIAESDPELARRAVPELTAAIKDTDADVRFWAKTAMRYLAPETK